MYWPPHTSKVQPVVKVASSSMKEMALAHSSGVPMRPMGTRFSVAYRLGSMRVSMGPGATQFTRMFSPATSLARPRVKAMIPALLVA